MCSGIFKMLTGICKLITTAKYGSTKDSFTRVHMVAPLQTTSNEYISYATQLEWDEEW